MITDRGEINRSVIAVGQELAEITGAIREMEFRQQEARKRREVEDPCDEPLKTPQRAFRAFLGVIDFRVEPQANKLPPRRAGREVHVPHLSCLLRPCP